MYGEHMNDLSSICTEVWNQKDLKVKKDLLKRAMKYFKYKAKIPEMLERIEKMTADQLDFLASNLILNKTDKVVAMLPR